MKKRRLLILIYTMLISLALVGCNISRNISETEVETETELPEFESETQTETEVESQLIKASVVVKYSEKEIVAFSDTTCFFDLKVFIRDGEFVSENTYGEFQITEGETITLTLDDLAPDFFSDKATIESASVNHYPYVYEDSPLNRENYKNIDCQLLIKCSSKEVIVYSDTTCFFDLHLDTEDTDFKSTNNYRRLKILSGETITLTLDDLAPGFFSDTTLITNYSSYIETYVEQ